MAEKSEVDSIVDIVLDAQRIPQFFDTGDGRKFAALPSTGDTWKLEQITLPNNANVLQPKTVVQHVRMQTTDSLIDYINRFKNPDTVVFADIDANVIEAVIDYHGPLAGLIPTPHRGDHRASLALRHSIEWHTWNKASGVLMSHTAFATFLEENSDDVVQPSGADLLELCRDLQVIQNVKFGSSVRMGDLTEINYQRESDAASKGSIALPAVIMLSIPVYFDEAKVVMHAFMRRKIEDGALRLGIQLSRAENVRQAEFQRIVDYVQQSVEVTTVYGTPA